MPNSTSAREVAAVQSAGTGNGSGRSCMSGRVAPGRGAGIEAPWWYQARCRSAAQASTIRSATSSRRPSSGRIASIQPRICPTVTGSCGWHAVAGRGPLELRAPREPVVAEHEVRLRRHADPQRVGHPAHGGDVALQAGPACPGGHGPFHVRVHRGQVPHGDLDVARLEPGMPRIGRAERLVDQVAERRGQVRADRRGGGEAGVEADQHPVVRAVLGQGAGRRGGRAVALLHRAAQRLPKSGALARPGSPWPAPGPPRTGGRRT